MMSSPSPFQSNELINTTPRLDGYIFFFVFSKLIFHQINPTEIHNRRWQGIKNGWLGMKRRLKRLMRSNRAPLKAEWKAGADWSAPNGRRCAIGRSPGGVSSASSNSEKGRVGGRGGGVSMGNRGARVTSQGPSTRINKHMATEITCYANEALFLGVFLSGFFLGYPF